MNNNPLVSIIIIFFNEEKFIEDAILSVLDQSYDIWELILVDDGSKDSSTEIALNYAEKYSTKIRYFEHNYHKNLGMSASRNLGIEKARGEFVAFLDADDVFLPNKIEQQVDILVSFPSAEMVYGPGLWWYSWTKKPWNSRKDFLQNLKVEKNTLIDPPTLLSLMLENEEFVPLPSIILVRREALYSVGCFEESFRGMYEDQVFFTKFFLKMRVYVSDICWCKYRQHPEACCSVAKSLGQTHIARIEFLKWLYTYLKQCRFNDLSILKNVQQELWRYRHPLLFRIHNRLKNYGISI